MEGLTQWVVQSPEAVYQLLSIGGHQRVISQTRSNDVSSRSHTVFTIILDQVNGQAPAQGQQPGAQP